MPVTIQYFVHGTTKDNENNIASGWNDVQLSSLGIQQSIHLGEICGAKTMSMVYSSDLKRAVDTAQYAFGEIKAFNKDKRLREIDYGKATQSSVVTIQKEQRNYVWTSYPDGESYTDVAKRIFAFLTEIQKKHDNEIIGLISHRAPQFALEIILNNKTWEEAFSEDWRIRKAWQPGWNYELTRIKLERAQELFSSSEMESG
jgi:broad specificity phosphatase PhoE